MTDDRDAANEPVLIRGDPSVELLLVAGIASHAVFDRELSKRRERLYGAVLLRRAVLLGAGLFALAPVAFQMIDGSP